jgi:hypothetical protein
MENKFKQFPNIDAVALKKKMQQTWSTITEDNIEVTLTTSAIGLLLFAVGIGVSIGISRCITKLELRSALRKQKKALLPEQDEK